MITDTTGEAMVAADTIGIVPVSYKTKVKLGGGPGTGGGGKFGENGTSHTVPTAGKTISDVLMDWQTGFGEGTINGNEFELPTRTTVQHQYEFEMLDPAFSIEVSQELTLEIPGLPYWSAALLLGILLTVRSRQRAPRPSI